MRRTAYLPAAALLLALATPACAVEPFLTLPVEPAPHAQPQRHAPETALPQANGGIHMDQDLAREHERFTQFATEQMHRMNATILGGKNSMQVHKDGRRYRARYTAIDMDSLVCLVRRSESNPQFFVGSVLYKESIMENVAQTPEACRKGPFEPVSEKSSRIIYSSKRGGGWQ